MSDPNALPIAGWYPDPEDEANDRWWNGATWSDHRRPRNAPAGWAPAGAAKAAKRTKKAEVGTGEQAAAAVADPAAPAVPAAPAASATPAAPGAPAAAPVAAPYSGQPAQPGYPGQPGYPAQPAYQPYAPAYAPNYAPAQPMRNPLAFAGMLTSLIALMFNFILFGAPGIVGAIISFVGLRKANELARAGVTTGNGRGMAIGGIVAGLVGAFLWNLFYFSVISPFSMS